MARPFFLYAGNDPNDPNDPNDSPVPAPWVEREVCEPGMT
jgi:hypothetical protein